MSTKQKEKDMDVLSQYRVLLTFNPVSWTEAPFVPVCLKGLNGNVTVDCPLKYTLFGTNDLPDVYRVANFVSMVLNSCRKVMRLLQN